MGDSTSIAFVDATFNPWWGCAKVSPGCDHCYAEREADGYGHSGLWGTDAPRRTFGDHRWNEPRRWNRRAEREGRRIRVFCASMADIFDKNAPEGARERLWATIHETPNLDWLLITKRIGNAPKMLPSNWREGYPNVWLGATVVNQEEADRDIPKLLAVPARLRFLSCEPLLGPVDLRPHLKSRGGLHWVVVGGESGPKARPMELAWPLGIKHACAAAGVPFFMKQLSQSPQSAGRDFRDFSRFPDELRVRQPPTSGWENRLEGI